MSLLPSLVPSFVPTVAAFVLLWMLSVRLRDVSIVDALWGPAFSLAPMTTLVLDGVMSPRRLVVLSLLMIWGGRLGLHLLVRNHGKPEDYRYAQMRAEHGERFVWRSLVTVFLLQALLVVVISMPVTAVFQRDAVLPNPAAEFGLLDWIAALVVALGVGIETVADAQLTRFRRDPEQCGKVLDTGLWRYSRHPNYFGDALVWFGFGLFGVASARGPWLLGSVLGPLVMWVLLLRVSGVALLEKTITSRRPEYLRYIEQTSAFVPWWPGEKKRGTGG